LLPGLLTCFVVLRCPRAHLSRRPPSRPVAHRRPRSPGRTRPLL